MIVGNLNFTPTEDRMLASIKAENEHGDIDAFVETTGPDVQGHEYGDTVHVLEGRYQRMTIEGKECILFKERALRE